MTDLTPADLARLELLKDSAVQTDDFHASIESSIQYQTLLSKLAPALIAAARERDELKAELEAVKRERERLRSATTHLVEVSRRSGYERRHENFTAWTDLGFAIWGLEDALPPPLRKALEPRLDTTDATTAQEEQG